MNDDTVFTPIPAEMSGLQFALMFGFDPKAPLDVKLTFPSGLLWILERETFAQGIWGSQDEGTHRVRENKGLVYIEYELPKTLGLVVVRVPHDRVVMFLDVTYRLAPKHTESLPDGWDQAVEALLTGGA